MFGKKQIQKNQERIKAFQEEFKELSETHGLDWGASLVECPQCRGAGKIVQMHVVDLKK